MKSGSNLVSEKFIWKQNEVEMLSAASGDSYETQNGRSTYYLRGLSAGSHTLVCRMTALGSDGQEFSAEQRLTVEVVPTDIRNNFWGESKSETQRNLTYYTRRYRKRRTAHSPSAKKTTTVHSTMPPRQATR